MATNEPGNDGKNRDPWGGGSNNSQPPDLEELVKKIKDQFKTLFGGGSRQKPFDTAKNSSGGNGENNKSPVGLGVGLGVGFLVLLVVWAASGIYVLQPPEEGVVLRFGKYLKTTEQGIHWMPRFIDKRYVINVDEISEFSYKAYMLNKDENIVDVAVAVQYRIGDPFNYLFNVIDPEQSVRQATASSLRQVVGHTSLDDVLTTGREQVRMEVTELLENILEKYQAGIRVTEVALLPAQAPEEVKDAFDDAIKAQEDEQRFINQAQAYVATVIPAARGKGQRVLAEANAYKAQMVLQSEGVSSRFLALLEEYQKAPHVTRERLYIDALQEVLTNSSKILLDVGDSNNLLYLPLDQMVQQQQSTDSVTTPTASQSASRPQSTTQQTHHSRAAAGYGAYAERGGYE